MNNPPKRGLGKGLGALIPTDTKPRITSTAQAQTPKDQVVAPVGPAAVYAEIPIGDIAANPRQPRAVFDEEALAELVYSIKEIGLLQPVVVRRAGTNFELVAGERRMRACREAGLTAIPAIIRDTDDDALLRDALLENLHRADLNALEEAAAYAQMLADFGCTQEELARRIGRSRPQVSNTLRLLKLPPDVQRRVAAGVLSAGHARALLSLGDEQVMEDLAKRIVAEGLSVRSVEELILVGAADGRERTKRTRKPKSRENVMTDLVNDVQRRIADQLETRVQLEGFLKNAARGKIVIECADGDDLRRIADLIDRG
ncbi:MAG: ParB/RepB/Spo0J family partition protein [Actinomycetota bacterium]|nr:ParB/RepB/Spo0J family partition protein [Actinomycetota bacterium]